MNWAEEEADAGTYATCAYTYVSGPGDANGNKVRRMVFSGEGIVEVLRHVFPRKSYEGGKTRFKFTRKVDYTFLAQGSRVAEKIPLLEQRRKGLLVSLFISIQGTSLKNPSSSLLLLPLFSSPLLLKFERILSDCDESEAGDEE